MPVLSVLFAAPAQAQTDTTFVSNINQTNQSSASFISAGALRAQQFTTGDHSKGYVLSEAVVNIHSAATVGEDFGLYTSITDSNNVEVPGTEVVGLTGSADTAGEQSFTPMNTTTLSASTKYFVVAKVTAGGGSGRLVATASDDIDSGEASGWDIADNSVFSTTSGSTWSSTGAALEIAIKGTPVPNTAPTASNSAVTTAKGTAYTFKAEDFGFADDDGDPLAGVKVVSLPGKGSLEFNGTPVTVNQDIDRVDIDSGNLVFVPVDGEEGSPYTTFTFRVSDGSAESSDATMTINIPNNTPMASDSAVTIPEGTAYTFKAEDFGFADDDGDPLASVIVVSVPDRGSLELNGTPVTAAQDIDRDDIDSGNLVFVPVEGEEGSPYTTFTFRVSDGSAESSDATMTINIPNNTPMASDSAVTIPEGTAYTFKAEDFGFAGDDGDPLASVIVVSVPDRGSLELNGTPVTAAQDIDRDDIDSGNLVFVPVEGEEGSPYTTFTFRVSDGSAESSDATMTVNVAIDASGLTAGGRVMTAYLSRFGRAVADQAMDAAYARVHAPESRPAERPAGLQVSIAGHRFGTDLPQSPDRSSGSGSARLEGTHVDNSGSLRDTGEILEDFSFNYAGRGAGAGIRSLWGRGAISDFDGQDGDMDVGVKVKSLMLGADVTRPDRVLGVMLVRSRGAGDYSRENGSGGLRSTLTGVYPYGRHTVNERLSLWGVAGYGEGKVRLSPDNEASMTADMDLVMAAGGFRSELLKGDYGDGRWVVAAVADAMIAHASSDAVEGGLPKTDADASRIQLGLEGAWMRLPAGSGWITPAVRVGVRHDGGDAEKGFGVDIGAGVNWSDQKLGIHARLQARGLAIHDEDEFREHSISGSLSWDPRPDSERGARFSLNSGIRGASVNGPDKLLTGSAFSHSVTGLDKAGDAPGHITQRWEAKMGYGFGAFGDRFTAIPQIGLGWSDDVRDYSVGWRLTPAGSDAFDLLLEATHRRMDEGEPQQGINLQMRTYW